jgi:hypothetical protein
VLLGKSSAGRRILVLNLETEPKPDLELMTLLEWLSCWRELMAQRHPGRFLPEMPDTPATSAPTPVAAA